MSTYTREQLSKVYKSLPQELKDWIVSDEAFEAIDRILETNQVQDTRAGQISELIRNVLFGLLPPEDFLKNLQTEVKLKETLAKKMTQEINRLIFFPVKESLARLYQIGNAENGNVTAKEEAIPKPTEEDTYRETIE